VKALSAPGSDVVRGPGGHKRGDHGDHGLIPPLGVEALGPVDRGSGRKIYPIIVSRANHFLRSSSPGLSSASAPLRNTERAKRENVTVSKLVREILQRYVDEQAV